MISQAGEIVARKMYLKQFIIHSIHTSFLRLTRYKSFTFILFPFLFLTLTPAAREYMGREIAQTMHYSGAEWLLRESREREEATGEVMKQLKIKPGMVVCDLGSGNGYYTLKLARQVGEQGQVLAVDIQQEMLSMLQKRSKAENLQNIRTILGTETDPNLPPDTFDLVLLVDVYHEFSHPEDMLKSIRTSLKDNGRVALLEYRAEDASVPIKPLHKMSKEQILKEFTANGFTLAEEYDELPWQHMMFFQRAETDSHHN
ncbi:MAG: class I SAM-dependent methyltransferase [bacterium]|jgi:ubiquinone/menaquinone biosynthesis C-methylase UbiE